MKITDNKYVAPMAKSIVISAQAIICQSDGIDPTGTGNDFEWGN